MNKSRSAWFYREFPISWMILFFLLTGLAPVQAAPGDEASITEPYDLLIINGRLLDGTGNPWYYADIGIRDGVIA